MMGKKCGSFRPRARENLPKSPNNKKKPNFIVCCYHSPLCMDIQTVQAVRQALTMNRQRRRRHALLLAVLMAALAFVVDTDAFVTPKTFTTTGSSGSTCRTTTTGSSLLRNLATPLPMILLPDNLEELSSSLLLLSADDVVDAEAMAMAAALGPIRTFFGVLVAVIVLAAGVIYATPNFIVPKFAVQLEKDTKRLRPGLWEEYEAKLKEGETMASRSDLLQEIGDIISPIIRGGGGGDDFDKSSVKKETQLPDKEQVVIDPGTTIISKKEAKKLKKKEAKKLRLKKQKKS